MSELAEVTVIQDLSPARRWAARVKDRLADAQRSMVELLEELELGKDARYWKELGYWSWEECCQAEFGISHQQASNLFRLGHSVAALNAAGGDDSKVPAARPARGKPGRKSFAADDVSAGESHIPSGTSSPVEITAADARRIEPHLPEVTETIRRKVAQGVPGPDAVRQAISQHVPPDPGLKSVRTAAPVGLTAALAAIAEVASTAEGHEREALEAIARLATEALRQVPGSAGTGRTAASSFSARPAPYASRPKCPPGCKEPTVFRFGRWICEKHG